MTNRTDWDGTRYDEIGLASVLAPVARRWRAIALTAAAGAGLTVAAAALRAPRYEARLLLATVSSQPGISLGGAAALLAAGAGGSAAAAQGGFQVSPALVSNLVQSRRVLSTVGSDTVPGTRQRVAERIAERDVPSVEVVREMDKVVSAGVSKETGLITVAVTLTDSALARRVAERLVEETSRAYVATARAQASALRKAQELRVDSASRMLRRAQQRVQTFLSGNRTFESYSSSAVEQQTLQRDLSMAEGIYSKAVGDREAAVAKELEQTPVVVVVDPLPADLPPTPRHLILFGTLAAIAVTFFWLVGIFVSESVRRQSGYVARPPAGPPGPPRELPEAVPELRRRAAPTDAVVR